MVDLVLAGGPCAGYYAECEACPQIVRAVVGAGGQLAVLDGPGDLIAPDEDGHAYCWDERHGPMFVDGRTSGGRRTGWKVITYRYAGTVDRATHEVLAISKTESEQLADEWNRAQARRVFLDGPGAERVPSHVRKRLEQSAAAVALEPASPQGQLF